VSGEPGDSGAGGRGPRRKPAEVTEAEVREALAAARWDLKPAADRLGVPRSSMYDLLAKYPGIRTAGSLTAEEITRAHQELGGDLEEMSKRLEVSRRALRRRVKELGMKVDD